MNRELDDNEKELTNRNLEVKRKDIIKLKESYEYTKDVIELNKLQRDFNEKYEGYKRRLKEEEEQTSISLLKTQIEEIEELIKITEKQLKEGVKQPVILN